MSETFEEKVYRIGGLVFNKSPGDNFKKSIKDPTFLAICNFVKAVVEDIEAEKKVQEAE